MNTKRISKFTGYANLGLGISINTEACVKNIFWAGIAGLFFILYGAWTLSRGE